MGELKVVSLDELRQQSTQIIPLTSPTGEGQIGVQVKRVSILGMCTKGSIPNPLLGVARQLFYNDNLGTISLDKYGEVIDLIAKEVLVSPTYEDFEQVAPLTDDQKFELYMYSQKGLEGIENFRNLSKNTDSTEHGESIQDKAESNIESK